MQTSAFCCIIYLTDGPGPGTLFNEYDLIVPEKKEDLFFFILCWFMKLSHILIRKKE